MAYLSKDLSVLAYANGFTLWHYTTTDSSLPSVMETSTGTQVNPYFNPASDMVRAGDLILANIDTNGANPHIRLLLITKAGKGEVVFQTV